MKKNVILIVLFLLFFSPTKAQDKSEYIDSSLKLGNKTIWIRFGQGVKNNVCIDTDSNVKECLFFCKYCGSKALGLTDDYYMIPIKESGILYMVDEFEVNYYDIHTTKTTLAEMFLENENKYMQKVVDLPEFMIIRGAAYDTHHFLTSGNRGDKKDEKLARFVENIHEDLFVKIRKMLV